MPDPREPAPADPRGFIPPHPTSEQARHVNDALRSDDFYPTQVGVFCDRCGDTVEADYLVGAEDDQATRFGIARAHLRTVGWQCDDRGDFCPDHATPSATEVVPVSTPGGGS